MFVFLGSPYASNPAATQIWALSNANGLGHAQPTWQQLSPTGGPAPQTQAFDIWFQPSTSRIGIWSGLSCPASSCGVIPSMWLYSIGSRRT